MTVNWLNLLAFVVVWCVVWIALLSFIRVASWQMCIVAVLFGITTSIVGLNIVSRKR